uniref:Uncharacterized protein n=1 Tax=Tanacetum cinerariifolium TaxID=118510 RepID=A0A6L2MSM9_TANCI|nr:hypothetical protein [Tanacetum cinerariifolium]
MQTQTSNTLHNAIMEAGGKDHPPMLAPDKEVSVTKGSSVTTTERYMETYKNVSQDIRDQLNGEAEASVIERLKQGESINVQYLETNLYLEFGKFTSRDGESLESYYSRFYKKMNELVRNQCDVTNHQVNVQFLLQLQPEWQREQIDQNDDDDDLDNERELLASLIKKLKCEIDDNKNRNKFLETSKKILVDKLKGEIEDFKNKNKSLESSNNCFKEANNKLSGTNELMYKDIKKFQAELDRRNDVKYTSKVEIDYAKGKGDLISYKMESKKSFNAYTQKINDLNQTISEMKKELSAHQETISILSQSKEAQIKLYKTRKDKELDKVIALENKVKVLDNFVYKTGQLVQTMNMLNSKCKTSFAKLEFLKKAQRANTRLYDIAHQSESTDLVFNDDVDDFGTKIEPRSHKENLENVNDDDEEIEKENNVEDIEKENNDEEIKKEKKD